MVPTTAKNMINITDQMSNLADRTDIQRSWRRKPVIKDSYKLKKSEWYEKEKTKEKNDKSGYWISHFNFNVMAFFTKKWTISKTK